MLLVNISELDGLSYGYGTGVRLLKSHYQPEQCGLSRTVRAYDSHDSGWREDKVQMLEQQLVPIGLGYVIEFDDLVTEPRAVRDEDFKIGLLLAPVLARQLLVCTQTGL